MRLTRTLGTSFALAFLLLSVAPAMAEFKVGVVDTRRLATESNIGKSGLGRIRAMGDKLQRDIQVQQQTYQAAIEGFRSKALSMPAEKRQQEKDRLERQGLDLKRAAADARREIEREGKKVEEEIQKSILLGLQKYAQDNQFDVILDHLQCLFNSEATMVTDDVLRYLDANSSAR